MLQVDKNCCQLFKFQKMLSLTMSQVNHIFTKYHIFYNIPYKVSKVDEFFYRRPYIVYGFLHVTPSGVTGARLRLAPVTPEGVTCKNP